MIFVGAEAEVRRSDYLGTATVTKARRAKAYRLPELDARIRRERTRLEALVLAEARGAGVEVPRLLDADLANGVLELQFVRGLTLRDLIEREPAAAPARAKAFGRLVGRLHAAGLVHGDLTTSNVLEQDGQLVLIDFGLAQRSMEVEDRGVDLHLVERTFESSHPGSPALKDAFDQGYAEAQPSAKAVFDRVRDIKARARYA